MPDRVRDRARESFKHLLATYVYDPKRGSERLELHPLGFESTAEFDSILDTNERPRARCRYEINNRCLLAFQIPPEPAAEPNVRVTGAVSLRATIDRAGRFVDVELESSKTTPATSRARFINLVRRNLQVEPSAASHRVRVTFLSDADRTSIDPSALTLELPDLITVLISPLGR